MFVGVTIVCIVVSLVVLPAERQRRAVMALESLPKRVRVYYNRDQGRNPIRMWLADFVGYDYVSDVSDVVITDRIGASINEPKLCDDDLIPLRDLTRLKSLYLRGNSGITERGVDHFSSLQELLSLAICDNAISDESFQRLTGMSSLISLTLIHNDLAVLPSEIEKLAKLERLTIEDNQITALPPEIGKLINLGSLILCDNQLKSLPPEIGELTQLLTLSLRNNQLTSLPPEIGKLTNLSRLYLSGNPITDADLEYLKSLDPSLFVDLRDTKVTQAGVADLQRALPNGSICSDF